MQPVFDAETSEAATSELDRLRADTRARFAELDSRFERIEARVAAEGQKTRRHFDIMVEKLHASMRHVAARIQKIERR
ncbi:MAG TPA: hypothetical protein VL225_00720 [Vicinamibacterales bacterium]|jgi:hypothetical protein|nr:hypothetical protein [Vicinamibacterales bacterium]